MTDRGNAGPTLAGTDEPAGGGSAEAEAESGTVPRSPVPRSTVLIADDDEDTRCALAQLLSTEGYDVIEAADGTQALEILARAADGRGPLPDLVLLDFLMPGFSGLGILRVMRRFLQLPPTIIMTGFPDPSVDTLARNLGAVRVLRKPIREAELRAIVHDAILLRGLRDKGR